MNYEIGDKITARDFLGGTRTGYVVAREADIKNGRPGFDLAATPGGEPFCWGYDDQIVVSRPGRAVGRARVEQLADPCAGGRCPNPAAHAEGAHDF